MLGKAGQSDAPYVDSLREHHLTATGRCVIRGNWKFHLATTGGWPSCSFQDPGHCNWQEQDNLATRSLSHNVRNCSEKCSCLVSTKPPLLRLKPVTLGTTRKLERYGQKSAIDQEIDWSKDDWNLASLPGIVCHKRHMYFRAICIPQCPAHHYYCLAKRRKIILWRTWKGQWDIRQWKESSQFRSRLRSWICKNARGAEAFESGGKVFWFKSEHRTEKSCQVQVQRSWEVSWTPMIHQFA